MTRQPPPTLWLRCGTCAAAPNLATVTPAAAPRIPGSPPLPGEVLVVQPRRDGQWTAYPRKGSSTEFTHVFDCRRCGASYKVSAQRLAGWWSKFTAARRPRDVRYLGRDY